MWMMGYNDSSDFNMIPDTAFTGRKIRPLVPRTNTATATNNSSTSAQAPPCFSRIHAASDLLAQYHQLVEQRGVREFNTVPQVMVSSRWNPTPEQLRALEELYRRGTRTPSAEQIQQITSQLRRFGKIEGKNVFYWFQNHKARERQKRRRQMESHDDIPVMYTSADHQKKESSGGASRAVYEVEETKNWAPSKNCTTTSLQYLHHQQQETVKGAESRTEGWGHFDDEELHQLQRRNSINPVDKNATWQMTQLTCPPPPPSLHDLTHFISATNYPSDAVRIMGATMDHKLINYPNNSKTSLPPPHDLSLFVPSYMSRAEPNRDEEDDEAQTLELFPLRSNIRSGEKDLRATDEKSSMMNPNPSYQFFEFIPLKN